MARVAWILAGLGAISFLQGCPLPLNSSPPDYIKDVVAYKEGSDGVVIYFVLADSSGEMTTASGSVHLEIREEGTFFSMTNSSMLYIADIPVPRSCFQRAKVGMGAFEHEVILCSLGRIAYADFSQRPNELATHKVRLSFKADEGTERLQGDSGVSL